MARLALVTGASAGIGEALARKYASSGCDLVLSARREERLHALAHALQKDHGITCLTVPLDLFQPDAPLQLVDAITRADRHVDILVNNAGYGLAGRFQDTSWKDQSEFLQLMLAAPAELAHILLPGMMDRDWGRILNVASIAGMAPAAAGHTLYAATKAAMIRFSQSLHAECLGSNVHVTALCPGLTWTEFHDVNGQRERMNRTSRLLWQTAEQVAEEGWKACERNKPVAVTGHLNRLLVGVARLIPEDVAFAIMRSRSAARRSDAAPPP